MQPTETARTEPSMQPATGPPRGRWRRSLLASTSLTLLLALALACAIVQKAAAATSYTAGKNTVGSMMYTGQQAVLSATQVRTGSTGGVLSTVSVFVGAVHATPLNHMQVAVYADNGANAPGSLIAQSNSSAVRANAWNDLAVQSTQIAPNTSYWLVFNVDGSATQVSIASVAGGRSTWRYPVTYGTWTASYGASSRAVEAKQYSLYMTYSQAAAPPPPVAPPPPPVAPPPPPVAPPPPPVAPPPPPVGGTAGCGLPV
jgi:hypothetical protein